MRKILTITAAALTLGGSLAAATAPVQAQTRGHVSGSFRGGGFRGGGFRGGGFRGGHFRGGGGWGWGVGAGLAGFALGSALASPYYYGPGYAYGPGYYDNGYGCAQRVWDPYWGRWTVRYYC